MATVTGVVDFYVADLYIDDQADYLLGPARLSVTTTATGTAVADIFGFKRGGSIKWSECGSWANWPQNKWSPGIHTNLTVTSAGTSSITRGSGEFEPQLTLTSSTIGSALFGPTVVAPTTLTSSSTGNVSFSASATAPLAFTVNAEGGKLLHGVATGNLTITVDNVVPSLQKGGTAVAPITITTDANGVVRISAEASANLTITTSGTGNLTFLGNATANLVLTTTLVGGLVQKPGTAKTTFDVVSETRTYTLGLDSKTTFTIPNGETRVYNVLFETRAVEIPSETRAQPTEVY